MDFITDKLIPIINSRSYITFMGYYYNIILHEKLLTYIYFYHIDNTRNFYATIYFINKKNTRYSKNIKIKIKN